MALDSTGAAACLTAVAATGMWEGISLFCSVADPVPFYHDKSQSPKELLRDWRRMFPGAAGVQARLCVLGAAASGLAAWGLRDSNGTAAASFGAAAAANVGIFSFTMIKIMPLNRRLLPEGQIEAEVKDEEGIRSLLKQWGEMHQVRTLLGAAALAATAYGTHCLLTRK